MTDTDLRARLDAAITAARAELMQGIARRYGNSRLSDFDRYTTLVELRARWDEHGLNCGCLRGVLTFAGKSQFCRRAVEIESDVRRLLGARVDGPTEAHSARNDDQSSG